MVAAMSTATWIVVAVAALLLIVIVYVFGTKREERSHSEEGQNPMGSSEPDPPR
jgi:hypothetical protein